MNRRVEENPLPAWHEVLRAAGYPTTVLLIDFETYFDKGYSLSGTGGLSTIEFVMDPRFEVLGLGWDTLDPQCGCAHVRWVANGHCRAHYPEQVAQLCYALQAKYGSELQAVTVVAQNARFDLTVLSRRFGIVPKYSVDILGLARAWNARAKNDLASLAKRLHLPAKGHTEDFKGLAWSKGNITPEKAQALADYCCNDVQLEWEVFKHLLPRLRRPAVELPLITNTLNLFLQPTLQVDYARAESLAIRMDAEIEKACKPSGLTRKEVSGKNSFKAALVDRLEKAGDNPESYLKFDKKGDLIPAVAKADEQRPLLVHHADADVRALMTAKTAISSWPLHIARVNRIVRQAKAAGDLLPVPLAYHGAHTGRDSGGERINLQNMGNALGHKLIAEMRGMIVAPPGHELVIVDASQIEARKNAWAAGQWDKVEKFRRNEEIYCAFASKVLGRYVRKPLKHGIPVIEAWHAWARNSIGKVGELGCGYGMGKNKAVVYAKGKITLEHAEKIVTIYRAENPEIVQFWQNLEKAFRYTARTRQPCSLPRGFDFRSAPDCDVIITLPSGRELHYHDVRFWFDAEHNRHDLEVFEHQKRVWRRTWGGAICENVIQAISRDVLMEAALRLEALGHHVAHRIHDELVLVVPKGTGKDVLKVAIAELSRSPDWAPDSPLLAEGVVAERYGGH